MTRASLAAVRRTVTLDWPRTTEEGARKHLVSFARQDIAKIEQVQGKAAEVYANNPGNHNLDSVKLPGPIVAIFDRRGEIAMEALDMLRSSSPVQSGRYRNSHLILLNGAQVDVLPETLKATDVVTLVNPVPYARRIEVGKTESGRDFVIQVPNRIYERTAKKLSSKYRNIANIQFGYIEIEGAATITGGLSPTYIAKGGKKRRRRQQVGKNVQQPAIFIRARR